MGQLFQQGGLTNAWTQLSIPNQPPMIGSPEQVLAKSQQRLQDQAAAPVDPSNPMQPLGQGGGGSIGQPSFQQAATAGATPGGVNALSPGLNKAGKLITLLKGGLEGALAGRAASEQTVAATGGRRSGGAGMGFEAGYELPWQRESKQLGLEQQQAQVEATKAQSQLINTPSGPMPAWLAKAVLPASIRGESTENAAQTRAGATTEAAKIGAGARTGAAQIGADARIKAAQMGLGPLADVSPELQQQLGLPAKLPLKMLNQAESAANKPLTVVAGENDSYVVNKQTQAKAPLGVGNRGAGAVNAGLVPVTDQANPGNVTYQRRGNAVGAQSPQGAATKAAQAEARSEVPTKIGDQKVAFTTMISHADLLRKAAKAVNNGDTRLLNSIKNDLTTAFGASDFTNLEAIANAYNHEVTTVIAKGHMDDSEVKKGERTLPLNANYETIDKVLSSYQALGKSKMDNLQKQADAAKNPNANATGGPSAADMLKKYPPKK